MSELNAAEQFAKLQGQVDVTNTKLENTNKQIEGISKSIDILAKDLKEAIFSPEGINKRLSITYDLVLGLKNDRETDRTKINEALETLKSHDIRIEAVEDTQLKHRSITGFIMVVVGLLGIPLILQIIGIIIGLINPQ